MAKETQGWDRPNASKPEIGQTTPQTNAEAMGYAKAGINAAATWFYGATDPSTGESWGADQVGYNWLVGTDAGNLTWRRWCRLTTGPTYGWRDMRVRKVLQPSEPVAVDFSGASPAAADTGWTEVNLATLLDSDVQDSGQVGVTVQDVTLFVTLTPGASETVGASNCFTIDKGPPPLACRRATSPIFASGITLGCNSISRGLAAGRPGVRPRSGRLFRPARSRRLPLPGPVAGAR